MKPRLVFATTNPGKLKELTALMGDRVQLVPADAAAPGLEVVEDQPDFAGNARKKAQAFCAAANLPALADDSGLSIDALGGEPGVFSARWAPTDQARIAKALERLAGVPKARRGAHFACALCLALPGGETVEVQGRCEGRIAAAPRGSNGFGYDPIFLVEGLGQTMAELTAEQKSAHSHRGRAFRAILPLALAALGAPR